MKAWFRWLWQWIKHIYNEYKPKPRIKPIKPTKPLPKAPRKFYIPEEYTLEVIQLYDKMRNGKGHCAVEKYNLWKKIQEVIPDLPEGRWTIDLNDATRMVIREILED